MCGRRVSLKNRCLKVLITVVRCAQQLYQNFPIAQVYQVPAVFAIPTSWINGNTQAAYEAYGSELNAGSVRELSARVWSVCVAQ